MFTPDDLVVYPAQGVGKIERIDRKAVGDVVCELYIVRIRSNNVTLMVPVGNAASVGLRTLTPADKAAAILDSLRTDCNRTVFTGQNWNRRFREYSERLKSPDLAVVAEVLRELLLIGRNKELSFGERRLQEQAMGLVAGELAEVLHMAEGDIREELLAIYAPPPAAAEE
ncbi:MAG: CarD family transcriptional regulator [Desulfovibrio desulfuricans]|nr:CarD family transcriptional regulator [Desulfovibrio desulfuricans]